MNEGNDFPSGFRSNKNEHPLEKEEFEQDLKAKLHLPLNLWESQAIWGLGRTDSNSTQGKALSNNLRKVLPSATRRCFLATRGGDVREDVRRRGRV